MTTPRNQTLMPAAFLGHGSPMNALERNRYTQAWRLFGQRVPTPRAVLVVSAHWYVNATAVTAMARPRTIHDFYGFPQPLFDMQYPAPGLPALVEEVAELARPDQVGADLDAWGLDHGAWSVLVHAFPRADVPVVQLSIDARRPLDWHVALGAKLAQLRRSGVLVLGSGNVVHNLSVMDWQQPDAGYDWAHRFNEAAQQLMREAPGEVAALAGHPDFRKAVPTDEHFLPLLYLAGMAAADGAVTDLLIDGYAYGSLSMDAYTLGVPALEAGDGPGAAPMATTVAPEDANI